MGLTTIGVYDVICGRCGSEEKIAITENDGVLVDKHMCSCCRHSGKMERVSDLTGAAVVIGRVEPAQVPYVLRRIVETAAQSMDGVAWVMPTAEKHR